MILRAVTPRQEEAVRLRAQGRTLKQVGYEQCCGGERARQVLAKARRRCARLLQGRGLSVQVEGHKVSCTCPTCCAEVVRMDKFLNDVYAANLRSREVLNERLGGLLSEIRQIQGYQEEGT